MAKRFRRSNFLLILTVGLSLMVKISGCGGGETGPASSHNATVDSLPPVILSVFPAKGESGVAIDSPVRVTFSEPVDRATLTAATWSISGGNRAVTGTIDLHSESATFTPSNRWDAGTRYRVTLTTGIKDLAGHPIRENFSWEFTTGTSGAKPPTILSHLPATGAVNVPTNSTVRATFSKELDRSTVTNETFRLRGGGVAVSGRVELSGNVATFMPAADLSADTVYQVVVTAGVRDLAGNAMAADHLWTFHTGTHSDTTPPSLLDTRPPDQSRGFAVDHAIIATFSEAMDPASLQTHFILTAGGRSIPGRISYSGATAMFIPTEDLKFGTLYEAKVTTGARDLAGNFLPDESTWRFTTETTQNAALAAVSSTQPPNQAVGAEIRATVRATFTQGIDGATLNSRTFRVQNLKDATWTVGIVTYDRNTKTGHFVPQVPFSPSTLYQAVLSGVKDPAGNAVSEHAWTFITEKKRLPSISISPSALTFMAASGGPLPAAQALTFSDSNGGETKWSSSTDASWLTLSPSSGAGEGSATAQVTTTEVAPGSYRGTVTIASGGENGPVKIPVQYTVRNSAACLDRKRTPYIAFVTANSATLAWECAPQGRVEWGAAPGLTEQLEVAESGNKHRVTLPNLAPDAAYSYRVTANGELLGEGTFRTAVGNGENGFSFIVFGDSGQASSAQAAMASLNGEAEFFLRPPPGRCDL